MQCNSIKGLAGFGARLLTTLSSLKLLMVDSAATRTSFTGKRKIMYFAYHCYRNRLGAA